MSIKKFRRQPPTFTRPFTVASGTSIARYDKDKDLNFVLRFDEDGAFDITGRTNIKSIYTNMSGADRRAPNLIGAQRGIGNISGSGSPYMGGPSGVPSNSERRLTSIPGSIQFRNLFVSNKDAPIVRIEHDNSMNLTSTGWSVSFWLFPQVNPGASSNRYILSKAQYAQGESETTEEFYNVLLGSTEYIQFGLYKHRNNGHKLERYTATGVITNKAWNHCVFVYDPNQGYTGTNLWKNLDIYVNGIKRTNPGDTRGNAHASFGFFNNTSGSMTLGHTEPLGASNTGFGGLMTDVSIWSTPLDQEDVYALYESRKGIESVKSGIVSLPPRVMLSEADAATGSYPTIRRQPIDPGRMGNYKSYFDDRDTVIFQSPYARSKLVFLQDPRPGDTVTMQDANGNSRTFEFVYEEYTSVTSGREKVIVSPRTRAGAASAFAKKILNASSSFTIEAYADGANVVMTQQVPGTGGNTVVFTTAARSRIQIEDFKGGSSVNVSFPSLLASGSEHISDLVATPNLNPTLTAPGITRKGIADAGIKFTPGMSMRPFDESLARESFDIDSEFFATGSDPKLGFLGFDSALRSKTKVEFNIKPTVSTDLKPTDTDGSNFPMAYYNFVENKWDRIGVGLEAYEGSQGVAGTQTTAERNMVGFSHSLAYLADVSPSIGDAKMVESNIGAPISNYGFPFHPKFHATGSQLIKMSGSLAHPFVVEKMVLEFDVAVAGTNTMDNKSTTTAEQYNPVGTFFILNQRKNMNSSTGKTPNVTLLRAGTDPNVHGSGATLTSSIPSTLQISYTGPQVRVDTIREMVTYSQFAVVDTLFGQRPESAEVIKRKDLIIKSPSTHPVCSSSVRVMSASIRAPLTNPAVASMNMNFTAGAEILVQNAYGGRNGLGQPTGREIIAGLPAANPTSTTGSTPAGTDLIRLERDFIESPYILFPEDELVFGWQAPIRYTLASNIATMTLGTGAGKLTLYGSLIKNGVEFHEGLNQPLTSDAIHEALHFDNPVIDQFDTVPQQFFSGSRLDDIYVGPHSPLTTDDEQLRNWPLRDRPVNSGSILGYGSVRGIKERVSEGTAGTTGSFLRGLKLVDQNERYYDTLLPSPGDIHAVTTANTVYPAGSNAFTHYILIHSPNHNLFDEYVDTYTLTASFAQSYNRDWPFGYPFEPRYSSAERKQFQNESLGGSFTAKEFNMGTGAAMGSGTTQNYLSLDGANPPSAITAMNIFGARKKHAGAGQGVPERRISIPLRTDTELRTDSSDLFNKFYENALIVRGKSYAMVDHQLSQLAFFYGTGDSVTGMPILKPTDNAGGFMIMSSQPQYRGWKYGIANVTPMNTSAVYRWDRYGQFRDMLEQRKDTRVFDNNSAKPLDSAVIVRFVDRLSGAITNPESTQSQNLSSFVTSSMPYFDGLTKNRSDDPSAVTFVEIDVE